MLDKLNKADFAAYEGDIFLISFEPLNPVNVELIEVSGTDASEATEGQPARRSFALLFKCPKDRINPVPGIFRVEHEQGKTKAMEIYLTPVIGPDSDNLYYEAVFN